MSYLDAALTMGRSMAESMMRDKCRITRAGGRVFNEDTGQYENTTTTIYEGPCRLLSPYRVPSTPAGAGQIQNIENLRLSLPVEKSTGIHSDDDVEYLESASDPDLVGKKFKVSSVAQQSDATARRIPVQEVS